MYGSWKNRIGCRTLRKSSSGSSVTTSLAPLEKNPLPNGLYATIPIPSSLKNSQNRKENSVIYNALVSDLSPTSRHHRAEIEPRHF
jgi:hypothetical protein